MSDEVMSRSAAKRIEVMSPGEMADRVRKAEAKITRYEETLKEIAVQQCHVQLNPDGGNRDCGECGPCLARAVWEAEHVVK